MNIVLDYEQNILWVDNFNNYPLRDVVFKMQQMIKNATSKKWIVVFLRPIGESKEMHISLDLIYLLIPQIVGGIFQKMGSIGFERISILRGNKLTACERTLNLKLQQIVVEDLFKMKKFLK